MAVAPGPDLQHNILEMGDATKTLAVFLLAIMVDLTPARATVDSRFSVGP
jgi:hypothetical protein